MKKHFTNFDLKLIAIIAMTIDHIGYFLLPSVTWLRIIGRIAFPLFAFLCAESFRYTKDKKSYVLRLIVLGALYTIAQFILVNRTTSDVFLTLGLGFLVLWSMERNKPLLTALFFVFGIIIQVDYSWYGLCMIPMMYYLKDKRIWMLVVMIIMNIIFIFIGDSSPTQIFSTISLVFIGCYNDELGYKGMKWLFYLYYPLHIAVLIAMAYLIYS